MKILNLYLGMEINEYKTVEQYAKDRQVSVQAVYQAIKKGSITSKKIGKVLLIPVKQ